MACGSPSLRTAAIVVSSMFVVALSTSAVDAAPRGRPILWGASYNGDGPDGIDTAYAVAASPDGGTVFVTGRSSGSGPIGYDFATIAYDTKTGVQRWVARYDGPAHYGDIAHDLGVSPDGSTVFVTGTSPGSNIYDDFATVAYDAATGAERWVARFDGPGASIDDAWALAVSPDGGTIFVGGESYVGFGLRDATTIAYVAATGVQRWVATYNGSANIDDAVYALAPSPDGSIVYATGSAQGATTGKDFITIAYRAPTGRTLWLATYDDPSSGGDYATEVAVAPDGSRVFVTGQEGVGYWDDYATIAYDGVTGGRQLWVARYNGPGDEYDSPHAIGVSPDGSSVFVTGESVGVGTDQDFATIAYEAATGTEQWLTRLDRESGFDAAYALGVSPSDTTVFIAGYTGIIGDERLATVAYDASSGARRWASLAGPPRSGAFDLAVAPDGSAVFVAGSGRTDTSFDYVTMAIPA